MAGRVENWAADKVERRPLKALLPYARNARVHSDEQIAQLAASIKEWGWTMPILIDEGGQIIAGHGRALAAQHLGIKSAPVMVARGWSDTQKRAYTLADNKLTLNASWDDEILRLEIADLQRLGADLGIVGFSESELAGLFADKGLTDPDDAPPKPAIPLAKPGEVWRLGAHRVVCGDCTDAEIVKLALDGKRPHLMVTDPPYGVDYDANWRNEAARTSVGMGNRALGAGAVGKVLNDDRADWSDAWKLFSGHVAYVWHAGTQAGPVAASLLGAKFKIRAQIVWVKSRLVIGRGDYHHQHEPVFYGVRGDDEHWHFVPEHEIATYSVQDGKRGEWEGGRKQSTVWFIEHIKSETGHSTQKPVECMRRPLENNSKPGDAVYDPFVGSGTTIIAAEMTGRRCHAIELNPAYVDVTVQRWEAFTGLKALREGDTSHHERRRNARQKTRSDTPKARARKPRQATDQ